MKHLALLLLLSASLAAFSQVKDTTQPLRYFGGSKLGHGSTGVAVNADQYNPTPDTLCALILVTMCRKCAAEPMPGYVVIAPGKRPVYLNRCKKALKWPQVGWDWREVDLNYKK